MKTVKDLANALLTLGGEALSSRERLRKLYPHTPLGDPRTGVASNIRQIVSSVGLSCLHYDENLRSPAWWSAHGYANAAAKPEEIKAICGEYELALFGDLRLMPVSYMEAGLRRVVRALDPSACSGGTDTFEGIYGWLFKRLEGGGWTWSEGDPRIFLDLCRIVRNTVHNNGVFYPKNGKPISRTWRGKTYDFRTGAAPNLYDGWGFTVMTIRDIISLNESIMHSAPLRALPTIP